MHIAAGRGHQCLAEWLLANGADVDATSLCEWGDTPLHAACIGSPPAIVSTLLSAGADPNAVFEEMPDEDRVGPVGHRPRPLHFAAVKGCALCVDRLLEAGADPNASGRLTPTPLEVAIGQGHDRVVALLRDAGATTSRRTDSELMAVLVPPDIDMDDTCTVEDYIASVLDGTTLMADECFEHLWRVVTADVLGVGESSAARSFRGFWANSHVVPVRVLVASIECDDAPFVHCITGNVHPRRWHDYLDSKSAASRKPG